MNPVSEGSTEESVQASSVRLLNIPLLLNMLLERAKKLFSNCQIHIYTLSKILTLKELLVFIICVALYQSGTINFGNYHHVFSSLFGIEFEILLDIIHVLCLFVEFFGIMKKTYYIMVFSSVFRGIWIFFLILAANAMTIIRFLHLAGLNMNRTVLLRSGLMEFTIFYLFYSVLRMVMHIKICKSIKQSHFQEHIEEEYILEDVDL